MILPQTPPLPDDFDLFGDFTDGYDLQVAVADLFVKWYHTFLSGAERRQGRKLGLLNRPSRSMMTFSPSEEFEKRQDGDLPAVLIYCPGLVEPPTRHGRDYRYRWLLGVAFIVGGADGDDAMQSAQCYGAAARQMFLKQMGSLGGLIDGFEYVDERYDDEDEFPENTTRHLATAKHVLYVDTILKDQRFNKLSDGDIEPPIPGPDDPTAPRVRRVEIQTMKPGSTERDTSSTTVEID